MLIHLREHEVISCFRVVPSRVIRVVRASGDPALREKMMSEEIEDVESQDQETEETKPEVKPKPKPSVKPAPIAEDIDTMSEEELREHLRKARKALKVSNSEAASGREAKQRLRELEDEQERRREEGLTELERIQKKLAEADRAAKERDEELRESKRKLIALKLDREIEAEAAKLEADPKQVALMLRGMEDNGIEYDSDADRFNGVRDAVKKLVAEFPRLADGGMRRGRGTPPRDDAARPRRDNQASQIDVDKAGLISRIAYTGL